MKRAIQVAVVFALYFGSAWLGLRFDPVSGAATPVWPPVGVALAAVFLLGPRAGIGIVLGALCANLVAGSPPLAASGIAIGNTLEAFAGAWMLKRIHFQPSMARMRDVVALIAVSTASTVISASVGVASLRLAGVAGDFAYAWRVWWLGDVIGDILVAPLLFTWSTLERSKQSRRNFVEGVGIALLQAALALIIFRGWPGAVPLTSSSYAVFPMLIWSALRLGPIGTTAAMLLTAAVAVWGTATGHGPFAHGDRVHGLMALQLFMGVVAITNLLLSAALEERRQAVGRREELFDVVAHDLRNPLSAILMNSTQLLRTLPPAERGTRRHKYLEFIFSAAERMNHLLAALVQSKSIEAGQFQVAPVDQPIAPLVDKAVEMMEPVAAQKGIKLVRQGELGERTHALDAERMQQVFSNLIGNAIKFTPDNGTVTLVLDAGPKGLRVSVSDTGPGVPTHQIAHIFDRYRKGDDKVREGTGLGLYIAKGIVEAHGGKIWVDSTPGKGATFTFTLPCR
jgi:signal transduction histidine kinase